MIQIGVQSLTVLRCWGSARYGSSSEPAYLPARSQTLLRQVGTASSQVDDTLHTLTQELDHIELDRRIDRDSLDWLMCRR